MKRLALPFAALLATLLSSGASPASVQEAPDALLRRVSADVLNATRSAQTNSAGSQSPIPYIVEAKILPYVDFRMATSLAMGRYWRDATPEQQKLLTDQLRTSLMFSLISAIGREPYQGAEVSPVHVGPGDEDVQIASQVTRRSGQPIALIYRMEKTASGWKIYDVSVSGSWLVQSYKQRFASEINGGGIDGLIRMLATANKQRGEMFKR
jgi:phospholipid transport system substrate-binding protein